MRRLLSPRRPILKTQKKYFSDCLMKFKNHWAKESFDQPRTYDKDNLMCTYIYMCLFIDK